MKIQKNWILDRLGKKGYRITNTRKIICTSLLNCHGVFSAMKIIKEHEQLDRVSVYRTLELLEDLDIIHEAGTKDGQRCFEIHGPRHHHHVQCKKCGTSKCVPCNFEKKVEGFSKIHHAIRLSGVCNKCK